MEPRIPQEKQPSGERSSDSSKRTKRISSFYQGYMEKRRAGLSEEAETKPPSSFSKIFNRLYPPPEKVAPEARESLSERLGTRGLRSHRKYETDDSSTESVTAPNEAEFSFGSMLGDLYLDPKENIQTITTVIESETTVQQGEATRPLEQEEMSEQGVELAAGGEATIPPVESIHEIFVRQVEAEREVEYDRTTVSHTTTSSVPEHFSTSPQTLYERTVIHQERHREKNKPPKSSPTETKRALPSKDGVTIERSEAPTIKETIIIEKTSPVTAEAQRPLKQEVLKALKAQEVIRVERQEHADEQNAERLDRIIKKRLEEENRRAAENILETTMEAAKKNVAIESLYEKRHETRGNVDNSSLNSISSGTAPTTFTQQLSAPVVLKTKASAQDKPNTKEVPTKAPTQTKQAATVGFWLALLVIIIFAFAVILIR